MSQRTILFIVGAVSLIAIIVAFLIPKNSNSNGNGNNGNGNGVTPPTPAPSTEGIGDPSFIKLLVQYVSNMHAAIDGVWDSSQSKLDAAEDLYKLDDRALKYVNDYWKYKYGDSLYAWMDGEYLTPIVLGTNYWTELKRRLLTLG